MKSFSMTEKKALPPYYDMGQRIIKARETLTGMKQSEMTKALDLREPTYGNYERGHRRMPPEIMEKFQEITGCLSDYIYLGKEPMEKLADELSEDPALIALEKAHQLGLDKDIMIQALKEKLVKEVNRLAEEKEKTS